MLMMFGWILLLVVIIWVVSQLLNKNQSNTNIKTESAMDILKKRYGKDETCLPIGRLQKKNLKI